MTSEPKTKINFVSPERVLTEVGVTRGDMVIDYGCGAGHWVLAAARLVGSNGSVRAIDNDEGMLGLVCGRAALSSYPNVTSELIDLEKKYTGKSEPAELVVVANVLYRIAHKPNFASSAASFVGENGQLLFVDWEPRRSLFGPKPETRMTEEQVISLFEQTGLKLRGTVDAGDHHFGLVFDWKGEGFERKN